MQYIAHELTTLCCPITRWCALQFMKKIYSSADYQSGLPAVIQAIRKQNASLASPDMLAILTWLYLFCHVEVFRKRAFGCNAADDAMNRFVSDMYPFSLKQSYQMGIEVLQDIQSKPKFMKTLRLFNVKSLDEFPDPEHYEISFSFFEDEQTEDELQEDEQPQDIAINDADDVFEMKLAKVREICDENGWDIATVQDQYFEHCVLCSEKMQPPQPLNLWMQELSEWGRIIAKIDK